MTKRFSAISQILHTTLFPPHCLFCGGLLDEENHCAIPSARGNSTERALLCRSCFNTIIPLSAKNSALFPQFPKDPSASQLFGCTICKICGRAVKIEAADADFRCHNCMLTPPPYRLCRSLFLYNAVIKKLVMQLKFHRVPCSFDTLKILCQGAVPAIFAECDYIIPVPLHHKRLRRRGFNQSLLLAHLFFDGMRGADNGKITDKIALNLLQRTKNTTAQSLLNRRERLVNLRGVFAVNRKIPLQNRSVCLVDDVFTTGSTINECCNTLVNAGCSDIFVLTLARRLHQRKKRGAGEERRGCDV